ncbi:RNA-guided endonuclease InsQ/TnpB family protein [Promicromonospora iranensis]|uniref:Transposase n=1 Tax=Promicromonospora iranensis TaxID=1105144 RepID=A0ABU2CGU5_9MICO|nr:RNA-guided endonuclease TnpB family protein [Promicromonospora iranensis]MDR7380539.1 putative transposase [Promicromonospora iranensis]
MVDMPRHTSFRLCLDPSVEQVRVLSQHVGAARFAFNQALRLHKDARAAAECGRGRDSTPEVAAGLVSDGDVPGGNAPGAVRVPWTGFDLIKAFNAWKRSGAAGCRFVVDPDWTTRAEVTGLAWRDQVSAQVFEEACVDLGRALKAWADSRTGARKGPKVGFPQFKKKSTTGGSFRIRNKTTGYRPDIRIGDGDRLRSVSLPKIGVLRVRECTRRLRRMIATGRARILHVTVSRRASRWWISITVEAADLHPAARHASQPVEAGTGSPRPAGKGWVGVDRGLHALVVAGSSDGTEVLRVDSLRAFRSGLPRLRRLSKAVSRKKKGSKNRKKAVVHLSRQHARIRDRRRHVLHQVSNQLVKNHARLVLEDLNITGMTTNRKLSRAISDAAWGELARQITYKQAWRDGQVVLADRWFPSSKTCSSCGAVRKDLTLKDRIFECRECGLVMDRDLNAAVNLAAWAENHTPTVTDGVGRGVARVGDRQAVGPVKKAHRQDTPTHPGPSGRGGKGLDDVGTNLRPHPRSEPWTPEKGGVPQVSRLPKHAVTSRDGH